MRILSLFLMTMAAVAIASPVGPANLLEKRCDDPPNCPSCPSCNPQAAALVEAALNYENDPSPENAVILEQAQNNYNVSDL
jgi:hypothetical protein